MKGSAITTILFKFPVQVEQVKYTCNCVQLICMLQQSDVLSRVQGSFSYVFVHCYLLTYKQCDPLTLSVGSILCVSGVCICSQNLSFLEISYVKFYVILLLNDTIP